MPKRARRTPFEEAQREHSAAMRDLEAEVNLQDADDIRGAVARERRAHEALERLRRERRSPSTIRE